MKYERMRYEEFQAFEGEYDKIEEYSKKSKEERIGRVLKHYGISPSYANKIILLLQDIVEKEDEEMEEELRDLFFDVIMKESNYEVVEQILNALIYTFEGYGWEEIDEELAKEIISMSHGILVKSKNRKADFFTWDILSDEMIRRGELVYPVNQVMRAKLEKRVCPKCGKFIMESIGAISRLDNETTICSACGLSEAMNDYMGVVDI